MSIEIQRFLEIFQYGDIGFDEYDDVVIRRLVECVRVMKEKKIVVVLKGGLQAEESVKWFVTFGVLEAAVENSRFYLNGVLYSCEIIKTHQTTES